MSIETRLQEVAATLPKGSAEEINVLLTVDLINELRQAIAFYRSLGNEANVPACSIKRKLETLLGEME